LPYGVGSGVAAAAAGHAETTSTTAIISVATSICCCLSDPAAAGDLLCFDKVLFTSDDINSHHCSLIPELRG